MDHKDDGGPAFPVPNDANVNGQEGMTLRDKFAEAAIPAEMDRAHRINSARPGGPENGWHATVAKRCYEMADAMLKARQAS